jgi:hypothetical protein
MLICYNKHKYKENKPEGVLDTSKEICLELYAEGTKHMFTSPSQKIG